MPFKLNSVQRAYIAAMTARDVILKPRQVGMTTLLLALDLFHFLTVRGAHVVVVCQSITGNGPLNGLSAEIRRYIACLRRAGVRLDFSTEKNSEWGMSERDATLKIGVAGASEASAAKIGRSGRVTHLHCTEGAYWEFADETTNALFECVPAIELGSRIVTESTPNGAAGLFFRQCQAAQRGEGSYKLHFFPWHSATEYAVPLVHGERIEPANDNERALVAKGVTKAQLKWFRRKVAENGADRVNQEYPTDPDTCFLVSGRGFFDQKATAEQLAKTTDPIERIEKDCVSIWKQPVYGRSYVVALDPSEGGGGDPSGGFVQDRESGEHVASVYGQLEPHELARVGAWLGNKYVEQDGRSALLVVERNNHGHTVIRVLQAELKYTRVYVAADDKPGWHTNTLTRPVMLDELANAHRTGLWKSPDRNVLGQIRTFVIGPTGKPEAASGEHDDLVMAAAMAWAVRQLPAQDLTMPRFTRSVRSWR